MFIEDDELRELYKVASADHLEKLEQGLLALEKEPDDQSVLNSLLRETHSLKGDSRMLGVEEAEMLVHQIEEILNEVKKGDILFSGDICDRLYSGIDAVQKIATEAVTGQPSGVSAFEVMAQLMGAAEAEATEALEALEAIDFQDEAVAEFPDAPSTSGSAYIEDDELRELYKVASADHLEKLQQGLLALEKEPDNQSVLDSLLRETHSLKGDSRMLGVEEAEMLVHQMEEILNEVKKGETAFSGDICDRLYSGLDAVQKIATEAVTGQPSGVSTFHVMAQLMGAAETEAAPEQPVSEPQNAQAPSANTSVPTAEIATVRVDFPKLDALMTQAGELLVTKLRLERRNEDVSQLLALWESWNKDYSLNQQLISELTPKLTIEEREKLISRDRHEKQYLERFGGLVTTLKNLVLEDNARLDTVANKLETGIRNLRLLPLSTIFNLFPRMVRDLARQLGKEVELTIEGGDISVDKRILEEIKAPLTHIIRNAIDHGIETPTERLANNKPSQAKLLLKGSKNNNRILIEIIDDGKGLDLEKIAMTALKRNVCTETDLLQMTPQQVQSLIFAPGFSTRSQVSEISGRGVGLDVVRENVERLKGTVEVNSTWEKGCRFQLSFNTSLSTTSVVILEMNEHSYAMPLDFIEKMLLVPADSIFLFEGSSAILYEDKPLSVVWLKDIFKLKNQNQNKIKLSKIPCVIINTGLEKIGIFTDKLIEQQNIILKPQSKLVQAIPHILGATILSSGEVCMVIDPKQIVQTVAFGGEIAQSTNIASIVTVKPHILLVEDSLPIRTQIRRILISAGYDVTVAVDGLAGFDTLQVEKNFDAVVSDVEMPNLSGLEMTARIRQYSEYDEIPIILVTTLATEADKRKGAEAGANAYLTKGDFDQNLLLDTLRRLI